MIKYVNGLENIIEDLYNVWFLYEQPSIVLGNEEIRCLNLLKVYNFPFDYFTIKSEYILYRGVEDDVLWLGKNAKNRFPDLDLLLENLKIN